uniref:RING-type E3 ubiquitin transferase n=1 Tax=Panagrolaimus superbus TaxID=310955 RepID=A0A914Y271_9BILA
MSILGPTTTDTITGGKTLELSEYDKVRTSHPAVTAEDMIIKIGVRTLATELSCPICLDLLNVTMTTKECLHRFCNECISTALQRGNRECPTCRKKIVSKRSLRRDENVDALINTLWADRKLYDEMQTASLKRLHVQSGFQALQKSIEAGIKAQAANRRQRIQGSYDYERRKKRKVKGIPNGTPGETSMDTEGGLPEEDSMEPMDFEVEEDREREREREKIFDFPSDSSSDEDSDSSSDVSSDSSMLSFMSSDVETDPELISARTMLEEEKSLVRHLQGCKIIKENMQKMFEQYYKKGFPPMICDTTMPILSLKDDHKRVKSEIELELVPSILLQKRDNLPPICSLSHYVKVPPETKFQHLSKFIPMKCAEMMKEDGFSEEEIKNGMKSPEHFYIAAPNGRIRKLSLNDTVKTAFLSSTGTSEHLLIFFDCETI